MAAPTDSMTVEKETNLQRAELCPAESKIHIHNFSDTLLSTVVHFHVIKLQDSFFLWIGHQRNFDNLAMAMKTKFVSTEVEEFYLDLHLYSVLQYKCLLVWYRTNSMF